MKKIVQFVLVLAFSFSIFNCAPPLRPHSAPPPPPRLEAKPAQPGPHYVWISGHYVWRHGNWHWINGYWTKQKKGKSWVPGHWVNRRGQWVWVKGHWR